MIETTAPVVLHRMDSTANAYVYAIVVDGVVRYIGKGIGRRLFRHRTHALLVTRRRAEGRQVKSSLFYNKLAKALARGDSVEERIVFNGLSESQAYEIEREEIASAPKGQLWNVFEGGIGPTSADLTRLYQNEEHRAKHKDSTGTAEVRELKRTASKESWADPVVRARRIEALKRVWDDPQQRIDRGEKTRLSFTDPSRRARQSDAMKIYANTPEGRAKRSKSARTLAADPEYRQKLSQSMRAACARPETKAKKSEAMRRRWADPDYRRTAGANISAGKKAKAALA